MSRSVAAEAAKETDRDRPKNGTRSRYLSFVVVSYFAVVFSLICISSFLQKSPTVDEPIHLFSGYSYLKWGDFRANPEHPPFAKMWAALPLLLFDIKDSVQGNPLWELIPESSIPYPTQDLSRDLLAIENDGETLFFYAKLQMIALGILLGAFVYLWSKELFGIEAAVAALFIFVLDPNILAHSQIVHTDLPFTAFFFIATYFFRRALGRLTWADFILTCLFFALAAITKYSYPVILLAWFMLGLAKILSTEPYRCAIGMPDLISNRWKKAIILSGIGVSAVMSAYLFIWAVYGFRFEAIPGGLSHLHLDWVMPDNNSVLRPLVSFITEHRLFPEAWIYGQLFVVKRLVRDTFLFGQHSANGFWSYFPIAFLVKTPLPTLIVMAAGVTMLIRGRVNRKDGMFLVVPAIVYFFFAVWSRANIGLRYILPVYPFLFVLAGGAAAGLWKSGRWPRRSVALLAGWSLWSCISIYPHYLAFFNELVGGPKNGYQVLLDSNLDWGQDLKGLKRWMDANGIKKIRFLYFGGMDPEYYGIDADYLPGTWISYYSLAAPSRDEPEYVAMSAHLLYELSREVSIVKPFRSREPVATIGHSIFIFKIDESRNP